MYNRLSSVLSVKLRFLPLQSGNKIQDITWLLPVHAIIIWKPFPLGWNFRWTFSEKNFCYRSFVFFLTLPRLEFTTHQSRVSRFYSMFDLPLFVRVCHSYFIKRRDEHVERTTSWPSWMVKSRPVCFGKRERKEASSMVPKPEVSYVNTKADFCFLLWQQLPNICIKCPSSASIRPPLFFFLKKRRHPLYSTLFLLCFAPPPFSPIFHMHLKLFIWQRQQNNVAFFFLGDFFFVSVRDNMKTLFIFLLMELGCLIT